MTSNIEEVEFERLPDSEQVSDDFELFTYQGYLYAIRTKNEDDKLSFCLEDRTKWGVVSKAVSAIELWIMSKPKSLG